MERSYPIPRPIAVEFFCGAGGMSLGLEQAGFDVALGVDIDGHHIATHSRNFPYGKSLCASIVNLDGAKIRRFVGRDTDIDLVAGGPPCQGFSHMGLRDLRDPRNSLIDHFIRLVLELRPKALLMENVPGMLSSETRKVLDAAIGLLSRNGYNLTLPVRILDAADFGVPQQRKRLFLIGVRCDIGGAVEYPAGPLPGQAARPTVWQAISDLPKIDSDDDLLRRNITKYTKVPRSEFAKVARGNLIDVTDLSYPREWDNTLCSGCLRTRHTDESVRLYEATPPGETVPGHKLPRLDPYGICPTLRAGSDSTHGSYTAPRPIHPKEPRCITSREAARLHGFPDWFSFYPLKWHAYRQIGNAVCPPVARALGYAIRTVLSSDETAVPPSVIPLYDVFPLPENRPRTLKRIPQIQQFPPVIARLFENAYDVAKKRLRKASFSFRDVERAIAATGVNLHWTRADTFLGEIGRSRRVAEMLAPVHAEGYTILSLSNGKYIGKFVPVGTPGAIDDKDTLCIRVDEVHNAGRLPMEEVDLSDKGLGVVSVLSQPAVQDVLWSRTDCVVGIDPAVGRSVGVAGVFPISLRIGPRFRPRTSVVVTCKSKAMPTKSRLSKIGQQLDSDEVTVLVSATSKHLVALRFEDCTTAPREVARGAFQYR